MLLKRARCIRIETRYSSSQKIDPMGRIVHSLCFLATLLQLGIDCIGTENQSAGLRSRSSLFSTVFPQIFESLNITSRHIGLYFES